MMRENIYRDTKLDPPIRSDDLIDRASLAYISCAGDFDVNELSG